MIKKLRRKFILIALASVTAVLFILMTIIFSFNYKSVVERADSILEVLSTNMGKFPREGGFPHRRPGFTPETPYETRFFSARLDSEGNIISTDTMAIKAIDSDDIKKYAQSAFDKRDSGFLGSYRYKKTQTDGETLVVFVDCTRDLGIFRNFVFIGISVSLIGLFLFFVAIFFLSKFALSPVETALARQKRFITDASHELKTPLTVIDASIEVIEMENGESRWTENAKEQVVRLRDLCEGLVELTRLDEKTGTNTFESFDFSSVAASSALPFEAPIEAQGRRLVIETEENITVNGDKKSLARLVTLLMDNAVKYSEGEGDIFLRLTKNAGKAMLEVINPCTLEKGEHPEFFERFWRKDEARSDSKGFGIGLSVAKSIAEEHRGKIFAESNGKFVRIRFIF